MKIKKLKKIFFPIIAFLLILIVSCASPTQILYLQDSDDNNPISITYGENTLQVDDILDIKIGALIPEAALPFNKPSYSGMQPVSDLEILKLEGYLVSQDKTINFPILGTISVSDKTTTDLEKDLKERLKLGGYLTDPTVTVRLLNAKVTLLGELNNPGTYTFTENNMSFLQALGLAGDLNIYGNRKDIILIRTIDGTQTMNHMNLTSVDWLSSPFQNIKPNDVIVVNPNGAKIKSSAFFGNSSSFVAIASLLISTVVLINSF